MLALTVSSRSSFRREALVSDRCIWMIVVGEVDAAAQLAVAALAPYGVSVRGQKWVGEDPDGWMTQAQAANSDSARFIIVVSTPEDYCKPEIRRGLALFRLFLQTLGKSSINGLVMLTDPTQANTVLSDLPGTPVLNDWETVTTQTWPARAVARLHAPKQPAWPATLGIFAHEKFGTWLQVQPTPGKTANGCLLGVSGNESDISFHAVGDAGSLPERSVNEFEIKGLTFSSAGHDFTAWGLQNILTPDQAYFARLSGQPDLLAISTLPNGELDDVHLMCLR